MLMRIISWRKILIGGNRDTYPIYTIILTGAGVCSVICIFILGGVVKYALDKVA